MPILVASFYSKFGKSGLSFCKKQLASDDLLLFEKICEFIIKFGFREIPKPWTLLTNILLWFLVQSLDDVCCHEVVLVIEQQRKSQEILNYCLSGDHVIDSRCNCKSMFALHSFLKL